MSVYVVSWVFCTTLCGIHTYVGMVVLVSCSQLTHPAKMEGCGLAMLDYSNTAGLQVHSSLGMCHFANTYIANMADKIELGQLYRIGDDQSRFF